MAESVAGSGSDMGLSDAESRPGGRREGALAAVGRAYRRHPAWMLLLTLVVAAIFILAYGGYFLGWDWTGFKGNTFWDWLSLLITPVTIAVISILFTVQQSRGSVEATLHQQQDALLDAYFATITRLLVESHLLETPPDSPVRAVARAHTIATLQRVNQERKAAVVRFLDESGLTAGDAPVLDPARNELT